MSEEYAEKLAIPEGSMIEGDFSVFDDFSGNFDWIIEGAPAYLIRKSPAAAWKGDYGAELNTDPDTPTTGDYARIIKYFYLKSPRIVSGSFMFKLATGKANTILHFYVAIDLPTLDKGAVARVKIDTSTNEVFLLTTGYTYVKIADLPASLTDIWYRLEIRFNTITGKYETIRIGNYEFDASSIDLYMVSGIPQYTSCGIVAETTADSAITTYIDNFNIRAAYP